MALWVNKADRRLIPEGRLAGPMPWVIAIMIFLTVLAVAAGLATHQAANSIDAQLSSRATVQIIEADPSARARHIAAAEAILDARRDVAMRRTVNDEEIAEMLRPWMGGDAISKEIVLPVLIELDLKRPVTQRIVTQLQQQLARDIPDVRVDANGRWLGPVTDLLQSLQWLALGLVALLGLATTASVWLASRAALNSNRDTIAIVHLLGSTDQQISRLFQRRIALDAAIGGILGFAIAIAVLVLVGSQVAALDAALLSAGQLSATRLIALALVPVAGIALAIITARMTILGALRKIL